MLGAMLSVTGVVGPAAGGAVKARRAGRTRPHTAPPVSVTTTPPLDQPLSIDPARFDRLQAALNMWTQTTTGVDTITVAVSAGGQTWEGSARHDGAPGPDPRTRYRVASITKTVTAAVVLRSVEAGMLTLDGPLPLIDGVWDAPPADITVRTLLNHRSGLIDYTEAPGFQPDQPITPEQAVELSFTAPLRSAPGTQTHYVNSNYLVLGLLVQQVQRRSLPDLVTDLVGPVGLVNTQLEPPGVPGWAGFASGGVVSTVGDMAQWGQALFTPGRIISADSLALMLTPNDDNGGAGTWGFCPCNNASIGVDHHVALGHFTAAGGLFHFPRLQVTLVVRMEPPNQTNVTRSLSLFTALRAELQGLTPPPGPQAAAVARSSTD